MPYNLLLTSCAPIRRREFFSEGGEGWCGGGGVFFVWVRPWEVKR